MRENDSQAVTTSVITITPGLPASIRRIVVPLKAVRSNQAQFGPSCNQEVITGPVPDRFRSVAGEPFRYHADLGSDTAGRVYHLLLEPREDLQLLKPSGSPPTFPLRVLVLRENGPGTQDAETVTSGMLVPGQHTGIPLRIPLPGPVGSIARREVDGGLNLNLSPRKEGGCSGNTSFRSRLALNGTVFLDQARFYVEMSGVAEIPPGHEQTVAIVLEPYGTGVPSSQAVGRLSDTLPLGEVRLVVEDVASDLSQIRIAAVHGQVEQEIVRHTKTVSVLPTLAQVELFERRMLSNSDLLSSAAESGWLVLIFGELRPELAGSEQHGILSAGPSASFLSMPTWTVCQILAREPRPAGRRPQLSWCGQST